MGKIGYWRGVSLLLMKTLLMFSVSAGADLHHLDHHEEDDNAEGRIDGGGREQGGGIDRDRGGRGRGDRDRDRGGRGRRPDPNPYDPYPGSPCEQDPRRCGGNDHDGGWGNDGDWEEDDGGWNQTQRAVYLNQVYNHQYLDLSQLATGVMRNLRGYGLVGVDVEILNQWGPATIRLLVNNQQVDAQNARNNDVQLDTYYPADVLYRDRVSLGVQGRVHIGQVVLHFQRLGRR